MILYAYALADAIERVERGSGVGGEAPLALPLSSCVLVAGWIEARPPIGREALQLQDALVRHLHDTAPAVLPVRFGTAFADLDAAARSVDAFGASVRERLDLVRGREQMTLRISGASYAPEASGTSGASGGRQYLERRARQRIPGDIQPLLDAVEPLRRAVRVERGQRQNVLTVYHLINRGSSRAYADAVTRAAGAVQHSSVRVSGPSPAYAFADLGRLR